MLRLPQFSIAQLLGFTLVIALDVWAFLWNVSTGFWTTLVSQILFWTVLRIKAALRLEPDLDTMTLELWDYTIIKAAFISAICTLAGAIAFCTVCTVTAAPIAIHETIVPIIPSPAPTNFFPYVLFGVSIPLGIVAAAAWLWWTWPRGTRDNGSQDGTLLS